MCPINYPWAIRLSKYLRQNLNCVCHRNNLIWNMWVPWLLTLHFLCIIFLSILKLRKHERQLQLAMNYWDYIAPITNAFDLLTSHMPSHVVPYATLRRSGLTWWNMTRPNDATMCGAANKLCLIGIFRHLSGKLTCSPCCTSQIPAFSDTDVTVSTDVATSASSWGFGFNLLGHRRFRK